jgi:hypothetical protein
MDTISPQPVPKRVLANGHRIHGHRPRKQPLVSTSSSRRRNPPRYRKRNGIHGTYEGSPSTTTLDTMIWQRMRTPLQRHSGHPWHRHMFLYQTDKHHEGQQYHLQQNIMRPQTSQERKGTCPADHGRRQTRLLRRRRHFHGRHHNIQNPDQHHPLHRGSRNDDDGH